MALTSLAVKQAQPAGKTKRLYDERGLYLEISPAGGKWWRLKYRFAGKEKRLFTAVRNDLFALDPKTGTVIRQFGENGSVNLGTGLNTPGVLYKDTLILGGKGGKGGEGVRMRVGPGDAIDWQRMQRGGCYPSCLLDGMRGHLERKGPRRLLQTRRLRHS